MSDDMTPRERQYELDAITHRYAVADLSGQRPCIGDYVRAYPQYRGDLLEWALYWHTTGKHREPFVEPATLGPLSDAAQKALARIRAQRAQEEGQGN